MTERGGHTTFTFPRVPAGRKVGAGPQTRVIIKAQRGLQTQSDDTVARTPATRENLSMNFRLCVCDTYATHNTQVGGGACLCVVWIHVCVSLHLSAKAVIMPKNTQQRLSGLQELVFLFLPSGSGVGWGQLISAGFDQSTGDRAKLHKTLKTSQKGHSHSIGPRGHVARFYL